jgi:hypothetical protein
MSNISVYTDQPGRWQPRQAYMELSLVGEIRTLVLESFV